MWIAILSAIAFAGYGDPIEGLPSYGDRNIHMWTNAVRVAPKAFDREYVNAGCAYDRFESSEKTPKSPLYWNYNLNEAARFHSKDMSDNNHFSHDSSDGTPFASRVARFYDEGYVGENIAAGYANPYVAVTQGWMCSPGHRANIMNDGYNEMGAGQENRYYTQNFGGRNGLPYHAIAMGLHVPETPAESVSFFADFHSPTGRPETYEVILNGEPYDMLLEWGEPDLGVYSAGIDLIGEGCHAYYFRAIVDGETYLFPEKGSYTWGDCDFETPGTKWMPLQWENATNGKSKLQFAGCHVAAVAPAGGLGLSALGTLFVVARRRD